MDDILEKIQKKQFNSKNEQDLYEFLVLSITFIKNKVDINKINAENFESLFTKSEYASFWKFLKKFYDEKFSDSEKKDILKCVFELKKISEKEILDAIILKINSNNSKINLFLSEIIKIQKKYKIANLFGTPRQYDLDLAKKCDTPIDYYDYNLINILKENILKNIFEEKINYIDELNKKIRYDYIFSLQELNMDYYTYNTMANLIDKDEIEPIQINESVSPFFIISLIIMSKLKNDGKAALVLPSSCLVSSNDKLVRKYLTNNYLSEVINLPENLYPEIETALGESSLSLLFFEKNKQDDYIKFSNLEYCYTSNGEYNEIDIKKAIKEYNENSKKASKDAIRRNHYSLNPNIYINNVYINSPINLGKVTNDIFRGYQFKKDELKKMKLITQKDVNYRICGFDENNFEDIIEINSKGKNLDRYLLKGGDIILNARGVENSVITIPKNAEKMKLIATGSMIVIRANDKKIRSKYLALFLKSKRGDFILNKEKNNNAIYVGNIKNMNVSCPSIEFQDEILKKIEKKEKELNDIKNMM